MGLYTKNGIIRTYEEQVDYLSRCRAIDKALLDNAIADISLLAGEIADISDITFETNVINDGGETRVEVIKGDAYGYYTMNFYNIDKPYVTSVTVNEIN